MHKFQPIFAWWPLVVTGKHWSRLMTKPTKWPLRAAKTQISLGFHPVWSEPSLSTWRNIGSSATHWAHCEDSDQTGRMLRLIWVFAGRTDPFVGFVMRRLISSYCSWMRENDKICKSPRFHILFRLQEDVYIRHPVSEASSTRKYTAQEDNEVLFSLNMLPFYVRLPALVRSSSPFCKKGLANVV